MDLGPKDVAVNFGKIGQNVRPAASGARVAYRGDGGHLPENSERKNESKFIFRVLDKIIGASLFMLIFGVPLFFTSFAFQGVVFEKQLYFYFWLLLAVISWVVKGVLREELNIRRTPLDLPILAFWFAYLLSTVFSIDRWHSLFGGFTDPSRGFMGVTAMVIAYYLIISNLTAQRQKMLLTAFVASCSVVVVWSCLIFFNLFSLTTFLSGKTFAQYIPLSIIGTIKGLGVFLSAMSIILVLAVFGAAERAEYSDLKRKLSVGLLLFILALDLFLLMNIYGWVSWFGLFLGVVVFLVYILSKIVRPSENWVWLPMVLFVLVMVIKMMSGVSFVKVNLPVEVDPDSIANNGYRISWDIAKQSLKENFLLGSGPATYGYNFSLYRSKEFNETALFGFRFFQGKGLFFESLSTVGSVGTFFLVTLLLSYLGTGFYLISKNKERNKVYSLGLFSASIVGLAAVFGEKMDGGALIFTILLSVVALGVILRESEASPKYLALSLKSSPKFALALAFVFIVVSTGVAFVFVFLGRIYAADVYAGLATREAYQSLDNALPKMIKAVNYNDKEDDYYSRTGVYLLMMANKEAMKPEGEQGSDHLEKIGNYLRSSVEAARLGADMAKNNVGAIEALAQIYENARLYVQDAVDLAEERYQQALALEPHNPTFLLKLGQIKVSRGAAESDEGERKKILGEAKEFFQRSVDEKSDFADGYYQLAIVQDALGETDSAIENATKAVRYTKLGNAEYILGLGNMYRLRGKNEDYAVAEELFSLAIKNDDKNVNAHFFLGLTHEKKKEWDKAKAEYEKLLTLLPDQGSDENRKQLEKMISNVSRSRENTPENLQVEQQPAEVPVVPEGPAAEGGASLQDAVQSQTEN